MFPKVGKCTVVYLRVVITDRIIHGPVIIQLAVKIGSATHLIWIKPAIGNLEGTKAAENGLRIASQRLFFNDFMVPTKGMHQALYYLYKLMELQKPILLVTYSTQKEIELFYKAIRKIHWEDKFGRVIEGIVNTLPIFQNRYPDLYRKGEVDLPILAQHALGRDCSTGYFDTSRHFELLEELVSGSELRFELNKYSQSWGEIFPDKSASKNPLINSPIEKKPTGGLDPESSGSLVGGQIPVQQFRDRKNLYKQLLSNQYRRLNTSDLFSAQQQEIARTASKNLLNKIIEANEEIAARSNEDDLFEEEVPVQQFRDGQNSDEQLLINQDRRPNTPDSFAAQQQEITRNNRRRNNDFAFGREPGDYPEFGSLVEEQGQQFRDRQNLYDQLLIHQDRRPNTSDSFAAQQQEIPRKIRRRNNDVALGRELRDLNPESGFLVEEQYPQFPDWQNSDDQLPTNQDQSDKYDRFSALGEHIPEEIHEFIGEYEARRDNDDTFQRVPLPLPLYLPNQVNLPPVNPNQLGRDWIGDWNQEYNDFFGENDQFFP